MTTATTAPTQHEDAKAIAAEIRAFLDRHPHDGPRLLAEYAGYHEEPPYNPRQRIAGLKSEITRLHSKIGRLQEDKSELHAKIDDLTTVIAGFAKDEPATEPAAEPTTP